MTTDQIIILTILVIAFSINLCALIYSYRDYISASKAAEAFQKYIQEEYKRREEEDAANATTECMSI